MTSRRTVDLAWKFASLLAGGLVLALVGPAILSAGRSLAVGAPAEASPRLNAYFATDFTDMAYQQAAVNRVLKAWKPVRPLPAAGKRTVVVSTIGRDGALLDARFHMNSGQKAFDDAAMAAVKGGAPFGEFPKGYARPVVEVHWHFSIEAR